MSLWVPFVLQMKEVTNHLEEQESKLVRFFFFSPCMGKRPARIGFTARWGTQPQAFQPSKPPGGWGWQSPDEVAQLQQSASPVPERHLRSSERQTGWKFSQT